MLFHYTRTRKRQAFTLAINIMLLPILLYIFSIIGKDKNGFEEIYLIAEQAVLGVCIVLTIVMLWFLSSKDKFELYVTPTEFYSMHPTYKEWCFSVNPKDIKCIKHHYSAGSKMTRVDLIMNNKDRYQICQNYRFSRKKLYQALKLANPLIEIPAHSNLFKPEHNSQNKH